MLIDIRELYIRDIRISADANNYYLQKADANNLSAASADADMNVNIKTMRIIRGCGSGCEYSVHL